MNKRMENARKFVSGKSKIMDHKSINLNKDVLRKSLAKYFDEQIRYSYRMSKGKSSMMSQKS